MYQDPTTADLLNGSFIKWKTLTPNKMVVEQHNAWHRENPDVPQLGNWTLKMVAGQIVPDGIRFHNLIGKPAWVGACFEAWLNFLKMESPDMFENIISTIHLVQRLQSNSWYLEWALLHNGEWKSFEEFLSMRQWMVDKLRSQRRSGVAVKEALEDAVREPREPDFSWQ